jgi:hydrogenase-4 component E
MTSPETLSGQLIDLFATLMLLIAFAMIAQRRVLTLIHLFALQGATLVASTALVGYATHQPHLYLSAALTLVLKVFLIPWLLHRVIDRLSVRWDVEMLINIPIMLLIGIVLVVFAFNIAAPIAQLSSSIARGTLGIALDVLVGILILGVFLFQIREQFDSLDIRHLERLKED